MRGSSFGFEPGKKNPGEASKDAGRDGKQNG